MEAIEIFRLVAKEFANVTDDELEKWFQFTRPMVSRKEFGNLYEQALAYLTAHRMKMAGLGDVASSESGDGLESISMASALRLTSAHEGNVSVSFKSAGSSSSSGGGDYDLTVYGVEYQRLLRMAIIPIRCSGELDDTEGLATASYFF